MKPTSYSCWLFLHMDIKLFCLLTLIFLVSCKNDSYHVKQKYYNEVKLLKELSDQQEFLESIYTNHIELRTEETGYWNTYGRNSKEYKKKVASNHKKDIIDLQKVIAFLETYGHPNIMQLGRKAAVIPSVQLIHSQNEVLMNENYLFVYDAYKFNDIPEDIFYKYLQTLSYSSGNHYKTDNNLTTAQNIEYLIEDLGLN